MKYKSEAMSSASGSVGGTTYSRNRFGQYRRSRAIPVNPNTQNQTQVRNAFTELVTRWTTVLTAAEREAWNLFGQNTPTVDALGSTINLTGQNWYIAANAVRIQAAAKLSSAAAIIDEAPVIFDRGDFTDPIFTFGVAAGIIAGVTSSDPWANEDDAFMFLFQGAPQNASRNFFKGPFRLIGEAAGDSTTPPTVISVTAANAAILGYAYAEGQACWFNCVVVRADGRVSSKRIYGPSVATA